MKDLEGEAAAGPARRRAPGRGKTPRVMGWVEYVAFPEWNVEGVSAKVDTGARISALHVARIRKVTDGRIRFDVVLHVAQKHLCVTAESTVLRKSRIKSSNGQYQQRFVVSALIRIGDVERVIEVSLVSRPEMTYRMLLRRDALAGFLIDPSQEGLLGGPARAPRPARPAATPRKRAQKSRR